MADMNKEGPNEEERNFYETSRRENVEAYFRDGVYKVAQRLAKDSVVPPPDIITFEPELLSTDEDVALMLARVQVEDPHYRKINPATDQGLLDMDTVIEAKRIAIKEQKPGLNSRIKAFADKIFDTFIDKIGGNYSPARRTFITRTLPATALVLATAACGINPTAGTQTEESPGKETSTVSANEITPTPSNVPATATATETKAPTAIPTETQLPIKNVEVKLEDYEISRDLEHVNKLPEIDTNVMDSENEKFSAWVLMAAEQGLLTPELPENAVPFSPWDVSPMTQKDIDKWGENYGQVPWMIRLNPRYGNLEKRSWGVSAAWRFKNQKNAFAILIGYKNPATNGEQPDNKFGYWLYIFNTGPALGDPVNGSYNWQLPFFFPGTESKYYLSPMWFMKTKTVDGCRRHAEANNIFDNKLCNIYYNTNPDITYPKEILEKWQKTGNLENYVTINGLKVPRVPATYSGNKVKFGS